MKAQERKLAFIKQWPWEKYLENSGLQMWAKKVIYPMKQTDKYQQKSYIS